MKSRVKKLWDNTRRKKLPRYVREETNRGKIMCEERAGWR